MHMKRISIVTAVLVTAMALTTGPALAYMGPGDCGGGPGTTVTTVQHRPSSPGPGWCWDEANQRWNPPTTSTTLPSGGTTIVPPSPGLGWCWDEANHRWNPPTTTTLPGTTAPGGPANSAPPAGSPRFSDVPHGCWYGRAVDDLVQRGVIGGYPDGTFRADADITRAQFAAMLGRMLDLQADGTATFPDVRGHWAEGWIAAMNQRGIMQGRADGTFGPDDLITRSQACAFVARALGLPDDWNQPIEFDDAAGQWACGYIHQLWSRGIVSGYGNGAFGVYDEITRAQAAAMLWRCGW